jgi:1-acyl-sn-glycerol-3-phosphate acyltransferase
VFYRLLKFYARLAINIYCTRIIVNRPEVLRLKGPLLLACNHPNSFLDGMILTTLFDEKVYSLARGDAFKKPWVNKFLRRLQLLPVYRTSEGVENLGHNYATFEACRKTFEDKNVVLIFSEGKCENEWHLRPLRKGTARLAVTSWEQGIPLQVIPTALNYSSFRSFGKEVHLFFGEPIQKEAVLSQLNEGKRFLAFNDQLNDQLKKFVYEIDGNDTATIRSTFSIKPRPSIYWLWLPAFLGWVLHAPLYYGSKWFTKRFDGTGHYDSVLVLLPLLLYPFYLLLLIIFGSYWLGWYALFLIFMMPFSAWAVVQAKYQAGL